MAVRKELKESEVPEEYAYLFDFSKQKVMKEDERRASLYIKKTCIDCGKEQWVRTGNVRSALKRGVFSGCCRSCCQKGSRHSQWGGGRIRDAGYVLVWIPTHPYAKAKGYVHEHRLVMEDQIGRYLLPTETVHHKNGVRDDNRIENLELWATSHKSGQRYTDLTLVELKELRDFINGLIADKDLEDAA